MCNLCVFFKRELYFSDKNVNKYNFVFFVVVQKLMFNQHCNNIFDGIKYKFVRNLLYERK